MFGVLLLVNLEVQVNVFGGIWYVKIWYIFNCGYILLFYFEMIIDSQKYAKIVHISPKNIYPVLYYVYIIYNYPNNINYTLV